MSKEIILNDIEKLLGEVKVVLKKFSKPGDVSDIEYDIALDSIKEVYSKFKQLKDYQKEVEEVIFDIELQPNVKPQKTESVLEISGSEKIVENTLNTPVVFEPFIATNAIEEGTEEISTEEETDNVLEEINLIIEEGDIKLSASVPVIDLGDSIEAKEDLKDVFEPIESSLDVKIETTENKHKASAVIPDLFGDFQSSIPTSTFKSTVNDNNNIERVSLNERISQQKEDNSVANKLKKNPISDIKKSIGINEKFQIVNELFKGSLTDYNNFIDKLNSFDNLKEAEEYLISMNVAKQWDNDLETYTLVNDLLKRRYL